MIKNKNLIVILSAAILICGVSGCKKNKSSEPEKITFSWWGSQNRADYTLEGVRYFQEKNPEIQVECSYAPWTNYEKDYDSLIKAGNETDVMQINFDWLTKYSEDGEGYYDLMKVSDYIEFNNFSETDLEFGLKNGKLNAIPIAFNSIVPVFDKNVFEKYGVEVPKTWDGYFTAAKAMRKDGIYPMGIGKKHLFLILTAWFEQNYSKKVFPDNDTFSVSINDIKEILKFYKLLLDEKVIYPDISGFSKNSINAGNIAGVIAWCNESSIYADCFRKNGGNAVLGDFITVPGAEQSGWYIKPATMYAVKKNSAHPVAAAKFINFLLNDTDMAVLQNCEKGIPSSNKALTTLMEYKVLDSMEYEALMRIRFRNATLNKMLPVMENSSVINIFETDATMYISGKLTLDECSRKIYREINDFLKK